MKEKQKVNSVQAYHPISIDVINNSWFIKEVDLFGAANNIRKLNKNGEIKRGGIKISNNLRDSKYSEILYQTITNPLNVHIIYLLRIRRTTKLVKFLNLLGLFKKDLGDFIVKNKIIVNRVNAYAEMQESTICLTMDPYQQQSDIMVYKEKIKIDAFTKIKISMLPKTQIRLMFFVNE